MVETPAKVLASRDVTRRSLYRFPLAVVLAMQLPLSAVAPSPAFAADETAKARALFQEGVQLEAGGNYAGALAKFQEVAQVKRTPTVVFHIAFCQEKLGRLVEALGGYRSAAHEAEADPKSAKVAQTASEAIAALEKRIPTLTIKRGKGADLAKISIDGVELGGSMLDKAQQVDPGSHSIDATASGKEPFSQIVKLAEGETKTLEVVMKSKAVAAAVDPDEGKKKDDKKDEDKTPPPPEEKSIVPYVVLGAGGVSLLASGFFFLGAKSAKNDLADVCIDNVCPTSAQSTQDKAKSNALLGNITFGLGLVGVGVGTYLLVSKPSAPSAPEKKEASVVRPRLVDVKLSPTTGGMGASLVGNF